MAEVILMPKLSDTMTEGVVAEWHKKVGDDVESGELLAEIETDKATMEFESFYDGKLLYIGIEQGQAAPVNNILAIIGEEGEDIDKILADSKKGEEKEDSSESKEEAPEPKPEEEEEEKPAADSNAQETTSAPTAQSNGDGERIFASPLAKKLAKDKNIDLSNVNGSGENGRIVKRDIENYKPSDKLQNSAKNTAATGATLTESYTDTNISQMRKTIAKRLAESKFTAPHFYLTLDIDMDNAMTQRSAVNANEGMRVSFNDMVIKACAIALRKHPAVNSAWLGDKIRKYDHINIGVAVAVEDGLLVPVVRFADTKGLMTIGAEVREFAQKAKEKKLQPQDWEVNTFTISNLGMYNIEEFTAIINPPASCILAIGAIKQVPVVKDGQVVPGNVMRVTLSCDHRVVDGVTGSEFLNTFKSYMENPMMMLV